MDFSRRKLIQGTAAAAAVSAAPMKLVFGQSAEFTYKYAHNVPATHPMHLRAKAAADAIRAETQVVSTSRSFRAISSAGTPTCSASCARAASSSSRCRG